MNETIQSAIEELDLVQTNIFPGLVPPLFRIAVAVMEEAHLSSYVDLPAIAEHLWSMLPASIMPLIAHPATSGKRLIDTLDLLRRAFTRAYPGLDLGYQWEPKDSRTELMDFRHLTLAQLMGVNAQLMVVIGPSSLSNYRHMQAHRIGKTH